MIVGQIHQGSGLGNQLHRYVMTRVLATELGVDFGFEGVENFKGKFMKLDWGKPPVWNKEFVEERINNEQGIDIRGYDERIKEVKDGTRIDGEFQHEHYWEKYRKEVEKWLAVESLKMPDDLCVINFRGGEYKAFADLFLTQDYWDKAVFEMRRKRIRNFIVCTDDLDEARKFFPDYDLTHEIGHDWRMIRYAKHLILSNSSFAILPAWLGQGDIIAPKFWARHNIGVQATNQNIYKDWIYL